MPADSETFLGLEIGGTKLQVVAGTGKGMLERLRFSVERPEPASAPSEESGAEGIRRQISGALRELLPRHRPVAIGVGFGGPLDWKTGRIAASNHVSGWADFPLADWLQAESGLPAFVENDAHVAAWAEARHAAVDSLFYVTLGSGVGGGLVNEGRIFHGLIPGQAEIGHLRLDRHGATVETLCSGWAVDFRIRAERAAHPGSLLARLAGAETRGEARHLPAACAGGDAWARAIVRETGATLALGLSHVVHLMHPGVIVLGGGLSQVGEPLRAAVAEALPPLLLPAFQPGPGVKLSALGEDVVPLGALLLAREGHASRAKKSRQGKS